jgi:hypothetical protein
MQSLLERSVPDETVRGAINDAVVVLLREIRCSEQLQSAFLAELMNKDTPKSIATSAGCNVREVRYVSSGSPQTNESWVTGDALQRALSIHNRDVGQMVLDSVYGVAEEGIAHELPPTLASRIRNEHRQSLENLLTVSSIATTSDAVRRIVSQDDIAAMYEQRLPKWPSAKKLAADAAAAVIETLATLVCYGLAHDAQDPESNVVAQITALHGLLLDMMLVVPVGQKYDEPSVWIVLAG